MSLFSFLIPTRQRIDLIHRLFQSILDTTAAIEGLEIVLAIDSDDDASKAISHDILQIKKVILPHGATMGTLNRACFNISSGRYVMLMNDDVILRTKNWDKIVSSAASLYQDDIVLIHVNDLLFREKLCTFPILSRRACLEIGVCLSEYRRYRIDDHIYDVYNLLALLGHQRIVYLPDVVFEHDHYTTRAKGYPTHLFRSVDKKLYVPDQQIIQVDARIFDQKLEERKEAALKLASLIDKSRNERFATSQLVVNRSILADVQDSYSYRKDNFAKHFADLGRHSLRCGDYQEARKYFRQAFSYRSFYVKNLRRWVLSYLPGLREFYISWKTKVSVKNSHHKEFRESDLNVRSDEYISWLCTVVGGWLDPSHGNLRAFDYAVRHMPSDGAVIEIGSFLGLSTNIITYLTIKYHRDNPVFTCDPWVFEGTEKPIGGYFDASSDAYRRYAQEVFRMNTALFSERRMPYTIQTYSNRFFELWRLGSTAKDVFGRSITLGGSISFAYIDGAHTYDAALGDFRGVDQHLSPGGFILFDDSADDGAFEVPRVMAEVKQNPAYELVFKTPHYFFRKK